MQDEIQHLQTEVETLRSGGAPLESLDRSDGGNPSALMQKREIVRLTEELLRSDAGKRMHGSFEVSCSLIPLSKQHGKRSVSVVKPLSKNWRDCECARMIYKAPPSKPEVLRY